MFEAGPIRSGDRESVAFQEFEEKELSDALHQHVEFELCYILRGKGRWQLGAAAGTFSAGSLLVCPPRVLHAWTSESTAGGGGPCSGIVLRFSRAALPAGLWKLPEMQGLQRLRKALAEPLSFEVADRERLRARLRSVDRAQGVLRMARFYVALELLAGLPFTQVSEYERDASELTARDRARMEELTRFLQSRFSGDVSRAEAAARVGLEEAAFSRFFRRAMGTTFTDYVSSLRVRRAASLLGSRRDLPLDEVARQSGFGSLPSLHRQFKKRLGTTPDSYRKAANSEFLAP